jgi:hypothetical protein
MNFYEKKNSNKIPIPNLPFKPTNNTISLYRGTKKSTKIKAAECPFKFNQFTKDIFEAKIPNE